MTMRPALRCMCPHNSFLGISSGPLPPSRAISNGPYPKFSTRGKKEHLIFATGPVYDEAKNVTVFEAVASRLPWPIYMAGEDQLPDSSTDLSHIHLLGQLSMNEMAPWFAWASIYATLVRHKPFDLSALEAALSGCALVLSDIPSLRQIWGDAALFVPPDDPEALEVTLILLVIDPLYRQIMARRACQKVQELSSEKLREYYFSTYQELWMEYSFK